VVEVRGDRVRLAFDAPDQVRILRAELAWRQGEPLDADLDGRPG
jgi:sRNA-binding carbon storage regulator CsrA